MIGLITPLALTGLVVCMPHGLMRLEDVSHNPPASILARSWMALAEEGPIGTNWTDVSIRWHDGAYSMLIHRREPQKRWKVMLIPPIGAKGWTVRLLGSTFNRDLLQSSPREDLERQELPHTSSEVWTSMFATAYSGLPSRYTDFASFKIRAIPEGDAVVFFCESGVPVPRWFSVTVDNTWKIVGLDEGF